MVWNLHRSVDNWPIYLSGFVRYIIYKSFWHNLLVVQRASIFSLHGCKCSYLWRSCDQFMASLGKKCFTGGV